jgi:hypothetical protein
MPQLSSTGRLLVAANDIIDELKHPRPDVPFTQVGDYTITALAQLAAFKKKSKAFCAGTYSRISQGP